MAMIGAILPLIKGYFTMQRTANMLKFLKKVRFCRFYWFLYKNAVPCLSPPPKKKNGFLSFAII